MTPDPEDIIRVVDHEGGKKICHIKIYKEAGDVPKPVIELEERKEQQYFVYDVVKCFDNVKDAHDYAEKNGINDVEY